MKRNMLLESLDSKVGSNFNARRYSLADMISESYRIVYDCEEGSNMKKLAESHLRDVKENPRDIDRLSRQMSLVKELSRMTESGELKDEDLVDKESYDTVEPKERVLQQECNEAGRMRRPHRRPTQECDTPKKEIKESDDPDLTDEELEELAKHLETIRKERKNAPKTEMKEDAEPEAPVARRGIKCHLADSKKPREEKVDEDLSSEESQYNWDGLNNLGEQLLACQEIFRFLHPENTEEWRRLENCINDAVDICGSLTDYYFESKKIEGTRIKESYKGLQNFKKQSESKAFYKTFKKMNDALKEGKALTRQASIDLYKASNSALTQLSIELEHNPEFLSIFKESTDLLSKDVNSLRESLARGKAPSKKTMKSLAKFAESLLSESEDYKLRIYKKSGSDKGNLDREETFSDLESMRKRYIELFKKEDYALNPTAWEKDENGEWTRIVGFANKDVYGSKKVNEAEEEDEVDTEDIEVTEETPEEEVDDTPDEEVEETPEDDFVGDDEGDMVSEEADAFDQEYADARVELHQELVSNHGDEEDPDVQEKIAQDAQEVMDLPGITDEQIAELTGGETTEEEPQGDDIEDEPEEEEADEVEDDSEITDDELAELKSHLKEMRAARKVRESVEDVESALAKVTDALKKEGIRYSMRGKRRDWVLVSRKDLEKASQINRDLGTSGLITVAHPA